jgi:sugar O-acyltransferase (sialic acid O-acetyltransferase NeuD family)
VRYLVIGAAGYAQEVAWSLREQSVVAGEPCEMLFFDDQRVRGELPSGLGAVMGTLADLTQLVANSSRRSTPTELVLGVGLPHVKSSIVTRLSHLGLQWKTVIHPRAIIGPNVEIGDGSYVAANAVLTVNVRVGRFVTINIHCQVAHDDVIQDFVTLHPDTHLSGGVAIGAGAELGTGSVVIPGVSIGPWAVLGAGCTAVKSLPGGRTYVGLPAREVARATAVEVMAPARIAWNVG